MKLPLLASCSPPAVQFLTGRGRVPDRGLGSENLELRDVPTDTWLAGGRAIICTKGQGSGLYHKTLPLGTAAPIPAQLPQALPWDPPLTSQGVILNLIVALSSFQSCP